MAPKNKFTREQIISAALELTRKQGASALTARALAKALGVSTQPVFTCFTTMEEAREEVCTAAWRVYKGYVERGLSMDPPFFGVGVQYLAFARQEPELYKLLFLQQNKEGKSEALAAMERSRVLVRPSLMKIYRMEEAAADLYFRNMWLVVHSLATLLVTGGCTYGPEEMGKILTGFSLSQCMACKEIPGFVSGTYDRDALFTNLIQGENSGEAAV